MAFSIYELNQFSESDQELVVYYRSELIQWIVDPSINVQLMAVKSNPETIKLIRNACPAAQMIAVQNTAGNAIRYIKHPSEELQMEAIAKSWLNIRYIAKPTEKVQLFAVAINPTALIELKSQCKKAQFAAVREKYNLFDNCIDPCDDLKEFFRVEKLRQTMQT